MSELIPYILQGLALGLSAGVAPGPLTALLVSETLQHGTRAGVKVAMAPLITDAPVVLLILFVIAQLRGADVIIGCISLTGALFLVKLGVAGLRFRDTAVEEETEQPRSLRRAVVVNVLNPHPWLFWTAVGGPIILKASAVRLLAPAGFLMAFYAMLVGAKLVMAVLIGFSRQALSGSVYRWVNRLMGVVMLLFAVLFLRDGLHALFGAG